MVLLKVLKSIAGFAIRCSGILLLLRSLYLRHKATIVYYHDPSPEVLEKHLQYFSKHYNVIPLDLLVEAIRSHSWAKLPPTSLVVTLDDGYKGNFELLPIFKKYGIVPTIYICSQIVASNRHFWFKLMNKNPRRTNQTMLQHFATSYSFKPSKEYPAEERQALSREEINLMKDYVDFQAHSRFHPVLTECSETECNEEIVLAKHEVEQLVGKSCKHFSYPRGTYSQREIVLLKKAGYISGRTCVVGWNDLKTDPYKLKILGLADDGSVNWLVAQLTGIPQCLKPRYLKKLILNAQVI